MHQQLIIPSNAMHAKSKLVNATKNEKNAVLKIVANDNVVYFITK